MTKTHTEYKLRDIKRVAVIGAGPVGSAIVKTFLQQNVFDKIVAFERRPCGGGLWNYYSENFTNQTFTAPSLDAHTNVLGPFYSPGTDPKSDYIWPSGVYEILDTNVPRDIMAYKDRPWPKDTPLYPLKEQVLEYFRSYTDEIKDYVKFSTNVVDVRQLQEGTWQVTTRLVSKSTNGGMVEDPESPDTVEVYDAVVVANGNYDLPYIPDRPGLKEWTLRYPGTIFHSKSYKHSRQFKDYKGEILVVGNSASGSDLAFQLADDLKRNIYKSARSESKLASDHTDLVLTVKDVKSFDPEKKSVEFTDGFVLQNVDCVIFATGYLRHIPFLKEINSSEVPIVSDGSRLEGTYHQCLSYNYPGIAFACVQRQTLPSRLSETQGAWLARVFAKKLRLPSIEEMKEEEAKYIEEKGNSTKFHDLSYPEDIIYSHMLNDEIYEADKQANEYHGFQPLVWSEHDCVLRGGAMVLKAAYLKYRRDTGKLAFTSDEALEGTDFKLPPIHEKLAKKC